MFLYFFVVATAASIVVLHSLFSSLMTYPRLNRMELEALEVSLLFFVN